MRKISNAQAFLLVGGFLFFLYAVYVLGGDSVDLIKENFDIKYMWAYVAITVFAVCPLVWRWQVILKGYGEDVGFWTLLRLQLAGYAVGYVTPSARIGGEPLRIYMLNKDCGVDYKTGTASVVIDKYMEYVGSVTFGVIGLMMLFFVSGIPMNIRLILGGMIVFSVGVLFFIYYRLSREKGFFLNLFTLFLSKKRLERMADNLRDIDSRMSYFIIHQKKAFFSSYFFYAISGFLFLIEFKYLLLSFGIPISFFEALLISIVIGIANIVPLPMALGSLEAGQSGLFYLIRNDGSIGFVLSLVHRIRGMLISAIGFLLIMIFSGKKVFRESKGLD